MNIVKPTLIEFEAERQSQAYMPPEQSDSLFYIGNDPETNAYVDIFVDNSKFKFTVLSGILNIGDGDFVFNDALYYNTTIDTDSTMVVQKSIIIDNAILTVSGNLILEEGASIQVINGGAVEFNQNSVLTINKNASIIKDDSSIINMYGTMKVDVDQIDDVYAAGMNIDPSVVLKPMNMNMGDREYSLTDYDLELREKRINAYTVGDYYTDSGRLGYTWKHGSIDQYSQLLEISLMYGEAILGDFKFSVLGQQKELIPHLQVIESLVINKDTTLYIAESYKGFQYLMPELYIGIIPNNEPDDRSEYGKVIVNGTIIVDGVNAKITIDRKANLIIEESGSIYLRNSGSIINAVDNEDDVILTINGKLIIDSTDQIKTFNQSNIEFGENGQVIILNPYDEDTILFGTPNGKYDTDLYRIFYDALNYKVEGKPPRIEYHMSEHCGIRIDETLDFYAVQLTDWFGGRRIEQAVYDKLLIWEDGAYIELDNSVISWATLQCTLLEASRLFKSFSSTDAAKLRDVANRFNYAGFGNVRFRFRQGNEYNDVTMDLEQININNVNTTTRKDTYNVNVDNDGNMYIRNQVYNEDPMYIISSSSKDIQLSEGNNQFKLP